MLSPLGSHITGSTIYFMFCNSIVCFVFTLNQHSLNFGILDGKIFSVIGRLYALDSVASGFKSDSATFYEILDNVLTSPSLSLCFIKTETILHVQKIDIVIK